MILAAPLVIPFAKAVGLSIGTLGMAALADQVNDYIQENPEESMKILSTLVPGIGIGQIFMSKEDKISLEDLEDMTDEEAQDLSKEEKAELMKQAGKRRDRELSIATSEKIGLTYPDRKKQDIEYEIDERYDEGGVEEKKAPFDYTKFFRKRRADGGAIGIEVLFREKKNLGGLLTGQAKSIYDSMMAAGYFTEDEIRNAIINAGYEIPGETPTQDTGIIASAPNIINQGGGGGDGLPPGPTFNRNDLLGTSDYQGTGPGFIESILGIPAALVNAYAKISPGINFVKSIFKPNVERINKINVDAVMRAEEERKAKAAAERAAFLAEQQRTNIASQLGGPDGTSGGQYQGGAAFASANPYGGSGTMDDLGADSFKDGGLVTMFVEKR